MLFDVEVIYIFTYLLVILAVVQYLERNDEFLFIPVLFFVATGVFRYDAVISGKADWAIVAYSRDIFHLTNELGEEALNYFFWGTATFSLAYFFFSRNTEEKRIVYDSNELFSKFLDKHRTHIIYLFLIVLGVTAAANGVLRGVSAIAYGLSYFYLFQLAIGGMILLMYLVFDKVSWNTNSTDKLLFGLGILIAAYFSYNPNLRFQFLSWMLALAIFWGKNKAPVLKFRFYSIGLVAVLLVFSMAGNARHSKFNPLSFSEKVGLAFQRITIAEDLNMLDGMMMVLQVYPEHLEYHYGMEHMEIFMRPIPRAIWPGKPVGGYANKLGLNDNMETATVGISQTIYGSFYGEGGVIGIVIFSFLYAFGFVRVFQIAFRFHSPVRYLIKGIAFASWVPMLRGGDLPGIYAFVGMSFWPIFLFLWLYFRFMRSERALAARKEKEEKQEKEKLRLSHRSS